MAIAFLSTLPIMFGEDPRIHDEEFKVGTGRSGDSMAVYVNKDYDQRYHKYISLKRRWWHFRSPADRIRSEVLKAQRIAEKLNHQEMYMSHEAQIGIRNEY